MIINGFVAICTTENSVEIIALIADALDLRRQMAQDRGAGVVVANAGDLKHAWLALGTVPELGRNDAHQTRSISASICAASSSSMRRS